MKVIDADIVNESMTEKMDNIFKNEIYIIVKKFRYTSRKYYIQISLDS